ncbi:MAG: right-handed parallel beta-helix repeat-containing protein [Clostridia bacterium]|nr:right-handed parallel beta-helix repeat-containing protein [Clostridia bacterium]
MKKLKMLISLCLVLVMTVTSLVSPLALVNAVGTLSYKVSGYISPDFAFSETSAPAIKAGFKVEIIENGFSAFTDSNGYFEIPNVPANQLGYSLKISKESYLYRVISNVVVTNHIQISTQAAPVDMWAGDIPVDGVQDNAISMTDMQEIIASFNSSLGMSNYVAYKDFNKDDAINMTDLTIVQYHFNSTIDSYPNFVVPTPVPTDTPTYTPTYMTTNTPTNTPTIIHTSTSTNTPEIMSTNTPTLKPTNTPTIAPTNTPTMIPTTTSTNTPTIMPTNTPSIAPTNTPTTKPTNTPTKEPTNTPTLISTSTPTNIPIISPTSTATAAPAYTPTVTPTSNPTNTPTTASTNTPSSTLIATVTPVFAFNGPTYISGYISQNTVWTKENSPYIITGAVVIEQGVELKLMPGVVVKSASSSGIIYVYGSLNTIGTTEDPIVFTTMKDPSYGGTLSNSAEDYWFGINIAGTGEFAGDNVKIKYAGSSYNFVNKYAAIGVLGKLNLINAEVSNSQYHAIRVDTTKSVEVRNSKIENNGSIGLYIENLQGALVFDNNEVRNNGSMAVYLTSFGTGTLSIKGNRIINNLGEPIYVPLDGIGSSIFEGITGNTCEGNVKNGITYGDIVVTGRLNVDMTFAKNKYIFASNLVIPVGKTLTIQPGAVLKASNKDVIIAVEGKLTALGTALEPIVFTTMKDPSYGGTLSNSAEDYWFGINIARTGEFTGDNVKIRYAGNSYNFVNRYAAIDVLGKLSLINSEVSNSQNHGMRVDTTKNVEVRNSKIENNKGLALYIDNLQGALVFDNNEVRNNGSIAIYINSFGTSTLSIKGNQIINNLGEPIYVSLDGIGSSIFEGITGNTCEGNVKNGITYGDIVVAGSINVDMTFAKNKYIVVPSLVIPVGKTLTIQPGAVLKASNKDVIIAVEGKLTALGTTLEPIVFTSMKDPSYGGTLSNSAEDYWFGINIARTGEFTGDNVKIKYAGSSYNFVNRYAAIGVLGKLSLINSEVSNSQYHGIYYYSTISPILTNITFKNNKSYAVFNDNSSIYTINASYNYWGCPTGPSVYDAATNKWIGNGEKVSDGVIWWPYLADENHNVQPYSDAKLSDIKVNGQSIAGFNPFKTSYDYKLPSMKSAMPQITATANTPGARITINYPSSLPGPAYINVVAEDGISKKTYSIAIFKPTGLGEGEVEDIDSLPMAREDFATIESNARIYTFGGYAGGQYLKDINMYNPIQGKWSTDLSIMNTARSKMGIAESNSHIYVLGGFDGSASLSTVEDYDTVTGVATTIEPMNTPRKGLGAAVVNGKLYAIGGHDGQNVLDTIEVYNFQTKLWEILSPRMNTPRTDFSTVVYKGLIYVIGGFNGSSIVDTVECFNPVSNTWSVINKPNPEQWIQPVKGAGAAVVNGKMYLLGGIKNDSTYTKDVFEYNESNKTWAKMDSSMDVKRAYFGTASLYSQIYMIGGKNEAGMILKSARYFPRKLPGMKTITAKKKNGSGELTGNFSTQVEDMRIESSGIDLVLVRSYDSSNSGQKKTLGCGWTLNYESSAKLEQCGEVLASKLYVREEPWGKIKGVILRGTPIAYKTKNAIADSQKRYWHEVQLDDGDTGYIASWWMKDIVDGVRVTYGTGAVSMFEKDSATGGYKEPYGNFDKLKIVNGNYVLTTKGQVEYSYNSDGNLAFIKDKNGNSIRIEYDSSTRISAVKDSINRGFDFTYSGTNVIVRDTNNRSVTYSLDTGNFLKKVTDVNGRNTTYEYSKNKLFYEINAQGTKVFENTYDEHGRLYKQKDAMGNVVYRYYQDILSDENDKVTTTQGDMAIYYFDQNNNMRKVKYDKISQKPVLETDPDGKETQHTYKVWVNNAWKGMEELDENSPLYNNPSMETIVDRNANTSIIEMDERGNLTKTKVIKKGVTDPQNHIIKTITYYPDNNIESETDEDGKKTYYRYDARGNLTKKIQPLNGVEAYSGTDDPLKFAITYYTLTDSYVFKGLLQKVYNNDSNGQEVTYTYDANGNIQTVTEKVSSTVSNVKTYQYDAAGLLRSYISPGKTKITYFYDASGRLEKTVVGDKNDATKSSTTVTTYDAAGNVTKKISPNQYRNSDDQLAASHSYSGDYGTRYTYYPDGKVKKLVDPENNETSYTYNAVGNLQTETKGNGAVYYHEYDELNRPKAVYFKEKNEFVPMLLEEYFYTINWDGTTSTLKRTYFDDVNYNDTITTYDYAGRVIKVKNGKDQPEAITEYNKNGTVQETIDLMGYRTFYRYDGLNRLVAKRTPVEKRDNNIYYNYKKYEYELSGNKKAEKVYREMVLANEAVAAEDAKYIIKSYDYYRNGSLKAVKDGAGNIRSQYWYDGDGNLSKEDVFSSKTDKTVTDYQYNYLGKTETKTLNVKSGDLASNNYTDNTVTTLTTTYTYDPDGNLKTSTLPNNVKTTYNYDNMDRLLSTSQPGQDENGNVVIITTSTTYTYDGKPDTVTDAKGYTTKYTYDQKGLNREVIKGIIVVGQVDEGFTKTGTWNTVNLPSYRGVAALESSTFASTVKWTPDIPESGSYKVSIWYPHSSENTTSAHYTVVYDGETKVVTVDQTTMGGHWKTIGTFNFQAGKSGSVTLTVGSGKTMADAMMFEPVTPRNASAFYYDRAGRKVAEVTPKHYVPNILDWPISSYTGYTYDDLGRLKTKTIHGKEKKYDSIKKEWTELPVNRVVKAYDYDVNGNVLVEYDAQGYSQSNENRYGTKYSYTIANQVETVLDPESASRGLSYSLKYTYDALGRKVGEIEPKNSRTYLYVKETIYTFDDDGNIKEVWVNKDTNDSTSGGAIKRANYDFLGNITDSTDGNGNTTYYEYNAFEKVRKVTHPWDSTIPQTKELYQYNSVGNLKHQWEDRDENVAEDEGTEIVYQYDEQGRQIESKELKYGGGQEITTKVFYDKNGNKAWEIDGNGNKTAYTYDEFNRLIATTTITTDYNKLNPVEHKTTNVYDLNGNVVKVIDRRGNYTETVYDDFDRIVEKFDQSRKSIQKIEYNSNSAQDKSYDAADGVTTYVYDKNGRVTDTSDPALHKVTQAYDYAGNVAKKTDARGNTTEYTYDAFGRVVEVIGKINGVEQKTFYTYDDNGNMTIRRDSGGVKITFKYNAANKVIEKIDTNGEGISSKTESYKYYGDGTLWTKADKNGKTTTYTYDTHGRMLTQTVGSITTSYTYDNNGNQTQITETVVKNGTPVTKIIDRQYDELDRVVRKNVSGTGEFKYQYDINVESPFKGTAERSTDPKGNITTKAYDPVGRLYIVADGSNIDTANKTVYSYDDKGNRTSVTYPDGSKEVYTYYADNLLETLKNFKKSIPTPMDEYSYKYDAAHNQIEKREKINGGIERVTSYSYDEFNRLKVVDEPAANAVNRKITTYTYDASGNRKTETVTEPGKPEILNTYVYNDQNRLTSVENRENNVIKEVTYFYYDNNGNQTSVKKSVYTNGVEGPLTEITVNVYDDLNRLTSSEAGGKTATYTYNPDGLRDSKNLDNKTTVYIYEHDKVVLETDGAGVQIARNIYGTNLLSRTADGMTLYYMYNGHGDVVALVDTAIKTNMVQGKTVTSNGTLTNPAYATDGRIDTNQYTSVGAGSKWVQIDLGKSRWNDRVKLWHFFAGTRTYKDVIVQFSNDPSFQSGVTTVFNNDTDNTSGQGIGTDAEYVETSAGKEISFNPVYGRYVRLWSYGNTVNAGNHIVEIQVYESNLVGTYYYDAFGNVLVQTGDTSNSIMYAGYQYDKETGLYYLNARMYDPKIARFLQEDTYLGDPNDPLSLNLYTYCHNEPIMYWDPSGHVSLHRNIDSYALIPNTQEMNAEFNFNYKTRSSISVYRPSTKQKIIDFLENGEEKFRVGVLAFGAKLGGDALYHLSTRVLYNDWTEDQQNTPDEFRVPRTEEEKQRDQLERLQYITGHSPYWEPDKGTKIVWGVCAFSGQLTQTILISKGFGSLGIGGTPNLILSGGSSGAVNAFSEGKNGKDFIDEVISTAAFSYAGGKVLGYLGGKVSKFVQNHPQIFQPINNTITKALNKVSPIKNVNSVVLRPLASNEGFSLGAMRRQPPNFKLKQVTGTFTRKSSNTGVGNGSSNINKITVYVDENISYMASDLEKAGYVVKAPTPGTLDPEVRAMVEADDAILITRNYKDFKGMNKVIRCSDKSGLESEVNTVLDSLDTVSKNSNIWDKMKQVPASGINKGLIKQYELNK